MKRKTKFIIFSLIGVIAFTSVILYSLGVIRFNLSNTRNNDAEVHNINLFVDYNNGTFKEKYNFSLTNSKITAFDALNYWCDVQYVDYGDMGLLVTKVDGVSGDWVYSVNGSQPSVSSTKVILKNNTNVTWWRLSS
jgi:hypothetical protein